MRLFFIYFFFNLKSMRQVEPLPPLALSRALSGTAVEETLHQSCCDAKMKVRTRTTGPESSSNLIFAVQNGCCVLLFDDLLITFCLLFCPVAGGMRGFSPQRRRFSGQFFCPAVFRFCTTAGLLQPLTSLEHFGSFLIDVKATCLLRMMYFSLL